MTLTHKQEAFCNEYMVDFNATQAYIRAGYSARSADKLSTRMMGYDGVKAKIKELQSVTAEKYTVDREKVLRAVEEMAYNGESESNQKGALDMLMKHTGLYEIDNEQKTTQQSIQVYLPEKEK